MPDLALLLSSLDAGLLAIGWPIAAALGASALASTTTVGPLWNQASGSIR